MKNLESLKSDKFSSFEENKLTKISAIIGGQEGNTRGGFDYRDKCSKRRCDPATGVCDDSASLAMN